MFLTSATFWIDVGVAETSKTKTIELSGTPVDALAVAAEATSDSTPAQEVVIVREPCVVEQEWLWAIETSGVGIELVNTHVTVSDVDVVCSLVDIHWEWVFTWLVTYVVENGYAVEDTIGVVYVEEFTVAEWKVRVLVSELFTSHSHIDAVFVALEGECVSTSCKLSVNDLTVFVLIHELTIGGSEVQTSWAAEWSATSLDSWVGLNVEVLPLRSSFILSHSLSSHLTYYIALLCLEHVSCKSWSVAVEHAERFDSGRHCAWFHIVDVCRNFHVLQSRAISKCVLHNVGSGSRECHAVELFATTTNTLRNFVAAVFKHDSFESWFFEDVRTNGHVALESEVLDSAISEAIVANLFKHWEFSHCARSVSHTVVVDIGYSSESICTHSALVTSDEKTGTISSYENTVYHLESSVGFIYLDSSKSGDRSECSSTDSSNTSRNVHSCDLSVGKCLWTYRSEGCWKSDFAHESRALECVWVDSLNRSRNAEILQTSLVECSSTDWGNSVAHSDRGEGSVAWAKTFRNSSDYSRYLKTCEWRTACESTCAQWSHVHARSINHFSKAGTTHKHFSVDCGEMATESHLLQGLDATERHVWTRTFIKVTTEIDFFDWALNTFAQILHKCENAHLERSFTICESDFLQTGHACEVLSCESARNTCRDSHFCDWRAVLEIAITKWGGSSWSWVVLQCSTALEAVTTDGNASFWELQRSKLAAVNECVGSCSHYGVSNTLELKCFRNHDITLVEGGITLFKCVTLNCSICAFSGVVDAIVRYGGSTSLLNSKQANQA